jgi:hypothetical protein
VHGLGKEQSELELFAPVEISVELLDNGVSALERGESHGLADDASAEHFKLPRAILITILVRVFSLVLLSEVVPAFFCESFTAPIPMRTPMVLAVSLLMMISETLSARRCLK